ncbi:MAG: RsmG family class I SAM-dependent methyltransferase, partial [Pseudomonadota bacterium]
MNLSTQIAQNLRALDFDISAQRNDIHELIHRYLLLIEKWNRIHNLTAIKNPADMLIQHIMDSLAVIPHITGPHIVDVGSGAG